jgi:purine-binding chemotaxis protein CheW
MVADHQTHEMMAIPATAPSSAVSFRLGLQQYALPVEVVREVVRLPTLITLVGAAPATCGLLNLRGHYLPVFDGRLLIGEPAGYDLSKQIMIIGCARPELGLLVDQVDGIVPIAADGAVVQWSVGSRLIDRVVEVDHRAIILMSLAALLEMTNSLPDSALG